MSTVSLPDHATLSGARREARELQEAVRHRHPSALALLTDHGARHDPHEPLPLYVAHQVIARAHGFADWPALKHYFDLAVDLRWDVVPDPEVEPPADRFCRLAALRYDRDDPGRWREARALLADCPDLVDDSVWAAAAAVDVAAVRRHLDRDPGLAARRGGPQRWSPLYHLAYARARTDASEDDVVDLARILLSAGADPHEGYLWAGQPTPFTLITGAFGDGEGGPERQPAHPHGVPLARLLLAAGADPNDAQTLYNRMFGADDDHLELLFAHGLGTGDGGPWRRRLGTALDGPTQLLRAQLAWAVDHGMAARVRLLIAHGVDVGSPLPGGRTPLAAALVTGEGQIAGLLREAGAPEPVLDAVDTLVAAVMAGDVAAVEAMRADGDVVERARRRRPGLIVWATARSRPAAVRLLVDLGFDVDARGRGDSPVEEEWETALHHAAGDGAAELVELLLDAGADPSVRDRRFAATPAEWARFAGHPGTAAVLDRR
ncbi:ankyrin repeat domain-containing protein [Nakamurella deserti]|uniref:ankyrin repeat domain-containing protein n=1 Tax=Nakamurella deserti TaxID=2164074 RepID=UPI000DBE3D84|nr:ankyrin repeat domain-containing protein [Nakamurella deserti]